MDTYGIFSVLMCPHCDCVGSTYSVAYSARVLNPQTFNRLTAYSAHFGLLPYFMTIRRSCVSLRSSMDPVGPTPNTPSIKKALPSGVTKTQRLPIFATLNESDGGPTRSLTPPKRS